MTNATTHINHSPSLGDELEESASVIAAPAIYGPPVSFLVGPWLFLVLLLVPPFALLFTVVLVLAVGAGLLAAVGALLASPYLLVRHHRAHRATETKPEASPHPVRRQRVTAVRVGSAQPKGVS